MTTLIQMTTPIKMTTMIQMMAMTQMRILSKMETFTLEMAILIHIYCAECMFYLGKQSQLQQEGHCPEYEAEYNAKQSKAEGNFFISVPLQHQMKDLLECSDVVRNCIIKSQILRYNHLTDVCAGQKVKSLMYNNEITDDDFTLTFNIDGVPVFKSTNCSPWPIQCTVNELQYDDRRRNVLITGLWFGVKPNMNTFLEPLRDEAIILAEGFQWKNPLTNQMVKSSVLSLFIM